MAFSIRIGGNLSALPFPVSSHFMPFPSYIKMFSTHPDIPNISSNGSITENLSHLVDDYLDSHIICLPSFVQDTIHLLQILKETLVSPSAILVAIDVEALYSSIPHELGVSCIRTLTVHLIWLALWLFYYESIGFHFTPQCFQFSGCSLPPGVGGCDGDLLCPILPVPGEWEHTLFKSEEMAPLWQQHYPLVQVHR